MTDPSRGASRPPGPPASWAFPACLALFTTAVGLPALVVEFPPMQDLPVHAMIADIIAHPERHAHDFTPLVSLRPYTGGYLAMAALARFVPAILAVKIVMALAAAALPLAALGLAESFRRWSEALEPRAVAAPSPARFARVAPWVLVAAFPVVFTQSYYLGFVNYLLGTVLLLVGLASWVTCLRRPGSAAPCLATIGIGFCIALVHPFVSCLFAVGMAAVAAWNLAEIRRRPLLAAALVTNLLIPAAAAIEMNIRNGSAFAPGAEVDLYGFRASLRYLLEPMLDIYRTPLRPVALAGTCLVVAGAGWWAAGGTKRLDRATGAAATLFAAMLVLAFVLPHRDGVDLNVRLNGLVFLTGLAALGVWARPARPGRAAAGVVLGSALLIASAWDAHLRFDREARSVAPILDAIPPGSAVLPLIFSPHTAVLADREWNGLYLHFVGHRLSCVGGDNQCLLQNPLAPARRVRALRPAPDEFNPGAFRFEEHGAGFGWFLIRGEPPPGVGADLAAHASEVAASGPWRLFRSLGSGVDPAAPGPVLVGEPMPASAAGSARVSPEDGSWRSLPPRTDAE